MPKQQASAGRGGTRINAGHQLDLRPSETPTIREPKIFAHPLMKPARQWEQGGFIGAGTPSTISLSAAVTQAQTILSAKQPMRETLARLLSTIDGIPVSAQELARRRGQ